MGTGSACDRVGSPCGRTEEPESLFASPAPPPAEAQLPRVLLRPRQAGDVSGYRRLLLVRHAQSANKGRQAGQVAEADPGLTDLGQRQAEALGRRFGIDLAEEGAEECARGLAIVCSPMRRCLLTVRPAVRRLQLPAEACLCHGGAFEFGCAGLQRSGSTVDEICAGFPEFRPVGFNDHGAWDYQGHSAKETEPECRARAERLVEWLLSQTEAFRTIVLLSHQTFSDCVCQLLVDGTAANWAYGDIKYKLGNAAVTEVLLAPDGSASVVAQNDGRHLRGCA